MQSNLCEYRNDDEIANFAFEKSQPFHGCDIINLPKQPILLNLAENKSNQFELSEHGDTSDGTNLSNQPSVSISSKLAESSHATNDKETKPLSYNILKLSNRSKQFKKTDSPNFSKSLHTLYTDNNLNANPDAGSNHVYGYILIYINNIFFSTL